MTQILITKADGTQEPFDAAKLGRSLEHAGASSVTRSRVLSHVLAELHEGMTTEEIYRQAFDLLRREAEHPLAARYSIKRAVFALGPSGFPFESFLGEALRARGWIVRTEVTMTGRCVPHEVDVLAERDGLRVGIEAKFHNDPGMKVDIKDALYVHARYEDLKRAPEISSRVNEGWLVTNTHFTQNAIRFAQCSNLTLIGWDYPRTRGLLNLIIEAKVHPLTCLTTLTEGEKRRFLDKRIVLCKHVQAPHLLKEYGIKPEKIPAVMNEAQLLCGI